MAVVIERSKRERDVILTPKEIAEMFHVKVHTVGSWEKKGWLRVAFRTIGGQRRYRLSDVRDALARSWGD